MSSNDASGQSEASCADVVVEVRSKLARSGSINAVQTHSLIGSHVVEHAIGAILGGVC
jgi:hypothetical protein